MQKTKLGQVRIIGGKWRSRKLIYEISENLRPTKDFIRETVFNWLSPSLTGARCLDCFAGTGIFGFEALSRGAAHVTIIDKSPKIIHKLKENAEILGTTNLDFYCTTIPDVNISSEPFDIVFLDPPFQKNLIGITCDFLERNNLLKNGALIYVETEKKFDLVIPSEHWSILKNKQTGAVKYYLLRFN